MSSFSFDIDPQAVLGVPADATLEQIRDAYRRKCKTFHPDAGGEEWAFRVLVQSYELLSTARVLRATRAEPVRGQRDLAPAAAPQHQPSAETVRGGLHDQNVPLERMVGVEHLCVRYLWDDAAYLWLTQKQSDEERFLSCSLNLSWPDPVQALHVDEIPDAPAILALLSEIFDKLVVETRVVTARSNVEDDRFDGWLSFSSFDRSWKALKTLQEALREQGLGLRHWSRDLFIPRTWK